MSVFVNFSVNHYSTVYSRFVRSNIIDKIRMVPFKENKRESSVIQLAV